MIETQDHFHFRHFSIKHSRSTMKVGTDSLILGAWAPVLLNDKTILDIGTGSGVLALMIAQRTTANILAIDIDKTSVEEAMENFIAGNRHHRILAKHISLQELSSNHSNKFDFIISNPPFYQNSLLPNIERKKIAKHNIHLKLEEFIENTLAIIENNGRIAVVLPATESELFIGIASESGLFLNQILIIYPTEKKQANRVCMLFSRYNNEVVKSSKLVIRNCFGKYTDGYRKLTADFHAEGYL